MDPAASLTASLLGLVSNIENFQGSWIKIPDEDELELGILQSRLRRYREEFRFHGQSEGSSTVLILKKAEDTLKKMESRLSALDACVGSDDQCCFFYQLWVVKFWKSFFPPNIGKTIEKVNDDLDRIIEILKDEAELANLLQDAAKRPAIQTPLIHDNE